MLRKTDEVNTGKHAKVNARKHAKVKAQNKTAEVNAQNTCEGK
jgi:hypothetical protein